MTPRQAIASIPLWAKVGGIALAIAGASAALGREWANLPAQVARHDRELRELQDWRTQSTREFQALVCLLTLDESVDTRSRLRECGL